jgi:hypothetical protein
MTDECLEEFIYDGYFWIGVLGTKFDKLRSEIFFIDLTLLRSYYMIN